MSEYFFSACGNNRSPIWIISPVISPANVVAVLFVEGAQQTEASSESMISPAIVVAVLFALAAVGFFVAAYKTSIEDREQLRALTADVNQSSEDASPWNLGRKELQLYVAQNVQHSKLIFWLSILASVVGFIILGVTIVYVVSGTETARTLAGLVAGSISEFVSATFLFIYRSVVRQALRYTGMLYALNGLRIAKEVIDSIEDPNKRDQARINLVAQLVRSDDDNTVEPNESASFLRRQRGQTKALKVAQQ